MRRDKRFICLLAVLREKRSWMREKQTTYIYSAIYNTYTNTNKSECNATAPLMTAQLKRVLFGVCIRVFESVHSACVNCDNLNK